MKNSVNLKKLPRYKKISLYNFGVGLPKQMFFNQNRYIYFDFHIDLIYQNGYIYLDFII